MKMKNVYKGRKAEDLAMGFRHYRLTSDSGHPVAWRMGEDTKKARDLTGFIYACKTSARAVTYRRVNGEKYMHIFQSQAQGREERTDPAAGLSKKQEWVSVQHKCFGERRTGLNSPWKWPKRYVQRKQDLLSVPSVCSYSSSEPLAIPQDYRSLYHLMHRL